jgi:hypothetical protein
MKKLILLAILLFITSNSFAHNFDLEELIKMAAMSMQEFDSYISQKGYSFKEAQEKRYVTYRSYKYNSEDIGTGCSVTKCIYPDPRESSIVYRTMEREDFFNIRMKMKRLGFRYVTTESHHDTDHDVIWLVYRKGKIRLALRSRKGMAEGAIVDQPPFDIDVNVTR